MALQMSGPRCVARFDYEATEAEDLGFVTGDVIRLKEHVGDEWLRGELHGKTGVFPVAFVEIVEHLLPQTPAGSVFLDVRFAIVTVIILFDYHYCYY